MKIDDRIALAQEKLAKEKSRFEDLKKELEELVKERGQLQASAILDDQRDSKRAAEVDKRRNDVRAELEIYPSLISEIEAKIEALKKEKEDGILKQNLVKQKKAAREVERLSEELGLLLKKANAANIELQKYSSKYVNLYKLTNQGVFVKPTTAGSHGSLKMLAGVINGELEGYPRRSPRFPHPGPPI